MEGELTDLIQWAFVLFYVGAIFLYAGQEASSAGATNKWMAKLLPWLNNAELRNYVLVYRKTVHVLAYGVLTFLVYLAARRTKFLRSKALPFAVLFSLFVAIADESYQRRLAYRTGSWHDVLIDIVGIGVVVLGILARNRFKRKVDADVEETLIDE